MQLVASTFKGKTVGVLGMGRTGLAAARALTEGGAKVLCWDDGEKGRDAAKAAGFELVEFSGADTLQILSAVITSPGIPHLYPKPNKHIAAALKAGVSVDNDIGLFFAELAAFKAAHGGAGPRVVAITGSNGKSTTTALIHHTLRQAGIEAHLAGNIGSAVFNLPALDPAQVIVMELSSYQTELARQLDLDVGVFTNLSPDHLDRHNGMGGYFAAKARMFTLGKPQTAVIGVDEVEGEMLANQLLGLCDVVGISARYRPTVSDAAVFVREHALIEARDGEEVSGGTLERAMGLKGKHNQQNAAAAYAACRALGLTPEAIIAGFDSFSGLPHRMQRVAIVKDVLYVNDSKATNADAAEKSLSTYENIHWIIGGVAKEGGIEPLAPLFSRVKQAYLIGAASKVFAETCKAHALSYVDCGTLENAVAEATKAAQSGDCVLLAPACASFDQFSSFEERGEQFVKTVGLLSGAALLI